MYQKIPRLPPTASRGGLWSPPSLPGWRGPGPRGQGQSSPTQWPLGPRRCRLRADLRGDLGLPARPVWWRPRGGHPAGRGAAPGPGELPRGAENRSRDPRPVTWRPACESPPPPCPEPLSCAECTHLPRGRSEDLQVAPPRPSDPGVPTGPASALLPAEGVSCARKEARPALWGASHVMRRQRGCWGRSE